jgi:predicted nucleotidyltransferase component of viral defense system
MVASRETLQDLAAERQLQPATLERVIRLIDILDAFGADVLIGPRIALKGGTALNVFHSDLDRLSVDIDINYVGAVEKERMDADRSGLEDRISRLMESKGYAARREPSEHAGGQMDLPLRLRTRRGGNHRDRHQLSLSRSSLRRGSHAVGGNRIVSSHERAGSRHP